MTLNEINATIRNIIRTEMGMPEHQVMPANTNQPTGNLPFATVLVDKISGNGWDDSKWQDTLPLNVTQTAQGERKASVSIQFFRDGAVTFAERLRARIQLQSAADKFALNGIGLISVGDARNISMVINTFWEERAQIPMIISIIAKETSVIGTYGTFPISISTESETMVKTILEP